jgi:Rod binding domain-containing protein
MGSSMIGPGSINAQASLQQAQESQMVQQMNSARAASDTAKIEKGAKQFESMLLSSWLQQAEKSFATAPGDEDGDDDDAGVRDQMIGMGLQSVADAMVASGGIGIAKMIADAMERTAEKAESRAQTGGTSAPAAQNR